MTIVVGVDESEGALAALRFALDEAAARGSGVVVVAAWEVPYNVPYRNVTTYQQLRAEAESDAREQAERKVAEARRLRTGPSPTVTVRTAEGVAEDVLLDEARHADLIVVGRNRGGLVRRLVLGSVSSRLVHEAECPVLVVPPPQLAAPRVEPVGQHRSAAGRLLPSR